MKKRVTLYWVLIVVGAVAAVVLLVVLHAVGNTAAFNVVLGVVLGALVTTVPQELWHRSDRLHRARAASNLFRSDLYSYQEWIVQSVRASKWAPAPTDASTAEHLADLARVMPDWERWQKIGRARRYAKQLIGLSKRSRFDDESWRHAWDTFIAINEAKVMLAKFDGERAEPHWATEEVRTAVLLATSVSRRKRFFSH